jgi:hypothetical protein
MPSSSATPPSPDPVLDAYRLTFKQVIRSKVHSSHQQAGMEKNKRDLLKWLDRTRTYAPEYAFSAFYGSEAQIPVNSFALNHLAKSLLDKKYLSSKVFVRFSTDSERGFPKDLPVWSTLLFDAHSWCPLFAQKLIETALDQLARKKELSNGEKLCLANWVKWTIRNLLTDPSELVDLASSLISRDHQSSEEASM